MQELLNEAAIQGKLRGEKGVTAASVKRVRERCLRGFKG
jgi:hypothetical protein